KKIPVESRGSRKEAGIQSPLPRRTQSRNQRAQTTQMGKRSGVSRKKEGCVREKGKRSGASRKKEGCVRQKQPREAAQSLWHVAARFGAQSGIVERRLRDLQENPQAAFVVHRSLPRARQGTRTSLHAMQRRARSIRRQPQAHAGGDGLSLPLLRQPQ